MDRRRGRGHRPAPPSISSWRAPVLGAGRRRCSRRRRAPRPAGVITSDPSMISSFAPGYTASLPVSSLGQGPVPDRRQGPAPPSSRVTPHAPADRHVMTRDCPDGGPAAAVIHRRPGRPRTRHVAGRDVTRTMLTRWTSRPSTRCSPPPASRWSACGGTSSDAAGVDARPRAAAGGRRDLPAFLLPAMMGLFAQVGGTETPRCGGRASSSSSVVGAISTVALLSRGGQRSAVPLLVGSGLVYLVIAVVGARPRAGGGARPQADRGRGAAADPPGGHRARPGLAVHGGALRRLPGRGAEHR